MSVDNGFELGGVRSSGIAFDIPADRVDRMPTYDPQTGEHLWLVIASFRVNPDAWEGDEVQASLDIENLANIAGPMCFHCEEPYMSLLTARRCPGPPRDLLWLDGPR